MTIPNAKFDSLCIPFRILTDAQTSTALHSLVGFLAQAASSDTPSAFSVKELAESALATALEAAKEINR